MTSASARINPLTAEQQLAKQIAEHGPISVAAFMETAIEAYYARGRVFGKEGDFVTAPEISQIFGELIGLWCVTAWQALGQPRDFHLIECGPGRGTLMADVLRTVADVAPSFARSASIHLLERSAALQEEQRKTLAGYHVEWHTDFSTLPDGPLIIIANEFLDAFPITQFVRTTSGWCERLVTHDSNEFSFTVSSLPHPTVDDTFDDAPLGSILEQSEAVMNIVTEMAELCVSRPAIALLIDYGYLLTDVGETLQAVKNHTYYPALETPGDADLTAHVDFSAVAQSARAAGAAVWGPVEQGLWLRRLGATVRESQLSEGKPEKEAAAISDSIRRLIDPEAMGTLFKVLAITPPAQTSLAGFTAEASL